MMGFVNKIELSYKKYQINGSVRDENYKGELLFTMKGFVSFVTDIHSMYFMSTRFLKDKIDGVYVPQFQLYNICDTSRPSHKNLVELCREVNYMWWGNQELDLQ